MELQIDGKTVPMRSDDTDCRQHCTYSATTRLPATRIGAATEMALAVDASGSSVELPLPARVTVVQDDVEEDAPAAFLLLPLLAALYVARRWRQ